ncbi:hypothetical protein PM082_006446 [Marasmius tenuissimus]|nr:hypothetical protein PM082_006446 [Marasmius tenuissimus]
MTTLPMGDHGEMAGPQIIRESPSRRDVTSLDLCSPGYVSQHTGKRPNQLDSHRHLVVVRVGKGVSVTSPGSRAILNGAYGRSRPIAVQDELTDTNHSSQPIDNERWRFPQDYQSRHAWHQNQRFALESLVKC